MITNVRRRFWVLYPLWIGICALLFFALQHRPDPSRPQGRVQSNDAAVRAVAILRDRGFRGYDAVHVAFAGGGEGGAANRWVVLCDRVPHTALEKAVVVELDAKSGALLTIRKPVD